MDNQLYSESAEIIIRLVDLIILMVDTLDLLIAIGIIKIIMRRLRRRNHNDAETSDDKSPDE